MTARTETNRHVTVCLPAANQSALIPRIPAFSPFTLSPEPARYTVLTVVVLTVVSDRTNWKYGVDRSSIGGDAGTEQGRALSLSITLPLSRQDDRNREETGRNESRPIPISPSAQPPNRPAAHSFISFGRLVPYLSGSPPPRPLLSFPLLHSIPYHVALPSFWFSCLTTVIL